MIFASGNRFFTACASTCDAVCLMTRSPSSSLAVIILSVQSLSRTVLKSTISPSTSPAQAALASPSLISAAMSYTDFASLYSFDEPSFNVIFMVISPLFLI